MTLQRILAAVSGVLFLVLAILVATGFRGLQNYPFWARLLIAGLLVAYGFWRVRGAWTRASSRSQN